jgi:DNA-3-methyladenine glycosylase II
MLTGAPRFASTRYRLLAAKQGGSHADRHVHVYTLLVKAVDASCDGNSSCPSESFPGRIVRKGLERPEDLPVTVKDPVEWLSFSIVSQQISMAAATANFSRLLTALGGGFAPERVIAAEDATLLGAGLSLAKVRAVRGLAEQVENGRLEVGKFRTMPDEEIESELVAVPGIGSWSAQMFMMRCIRRPDVFPAGDVGVRAALTTLDKLDARITPTAAKQRSQVWRPYRTYAASYLWGYLWALDHPGGELIPTCRREVAPGALRARPGAQARPPAARG